MTQYITSVIAFLIILGLTLLSLHLGKYRQKHSCTCGAKKTCDNQNATCENQSTQK